MINKDMPAKKKVIVRGDACPDFCNSEYGDRYGVDWEYEPTDPAEAAIAKATGEEK